MKKVVIILLCFLVAAAVGIYVYKSSSHKPLARSQTEPISALAEFSTEDKIVPTDTVVKVTASGFVPHTITVKKGTAVVWINQTNNFVWPASNPHPTHTDYPEFDPKEPFKNGETWTFTFDRVGDWGYHDHLLPGMKGTVHVSEEK